MTARSTILAWSGAMCAFLLAVPSCAESTSDASTTIPAGDTPAILETTFTRKAAQERTLARQWIPESSTSPELEDAGTVVQSLRDLPPLLVSSSLAGTRYELPVAGGRTPRWELRILDGVTCGAFVPLSRAAWPRRIVLRLRILGEPRDLTGFELALGPWSASDLVREDMAGERAPAKLTVGFSVTGGGRNAQGAYAHIVSANWGAREVHHVQYFAWGWLPNEPYVLTLDLERPAASHLGGPWRATFHLVTALSGETALRSVTEHPSAELRDERLLPELPGVWGLGVRPRDDAGTLRVLLEDVQIHHLADAPSADSDLALFSAWHPASSIALLGPEEDGRLPWITEGERPPWPQDPRAWFPRAERELSSVHAALTVPGLPAEQRARAVPHLAALLASALEDDERARRARKDWTPALEVLLDAYDRAALVPEVAAGWRAVDDVLHVALERFAVAPAGTR